MICSMIELTVDLHQSFPDEPLARSKTWMPTCSVR